MHSCGAIRAIIPDLIEIGVDILNPVQVSAAGMDSAELKASSARTSPSGAAAWTPSACWHRHAPGGARRGAAPDRDFMPGGGFVFNTVHNIQADVPAENIMAMWETVREYGVYGK